MNKNNYICLPSKNKQLLFENLNNYESDKFIKKDKINDIFFNKNLNTIDTEIKANILKNILSDNEINKLLYDYEIKHLNISLVENIKDKVKYYFDRYSYAYSGYLFSSRFWKIRKNFNLDEYFIFENSINKNLLYDSNTIEFIKNIFDFFKRNIVNYDIKIDKYYDNRNSKFYIFFIFIKVY
jgi:hypothetical protein